MGTQSMGVPIHIIWIKIKAHIKIYVLSFAYAINTKILCAGQYVAG